MASRITSFQYAIQITIDDRAIDYMLTVDESGHVYKAKAVVFDLPEVAQKLIFGESDGQLERKVIAFTDLISYLLPLTLAGQLDTYKLQLAPILDEINNRLLEKRMKWIDLKDADHLQAIPAEVLKVFANPDQASKEQKEIWDKIICIIEDQNSIQTLAAIRHISYYHNDIAAVFFPTIIPFLDHNTQRIAFEQLVSISSDAMKAYLLKELEQPCSHFYASGILKALRYFEEESNLIHDTAIQFYKQKSTHREDTLASLMELLKEYPSDQVKAIGFDILELNNSHSASAAARALIIMDTPLQEIADAIMPFFEAADPKISKTAYTIFANNEVLCFYLPKATEVLDYYVKFLERGRNAQIKYAMFNIAYRKGIHKYPDSLYMLLEHESPNVVVGILELIDDMINTYKINPEPYYRADMLPRYLKLAQNTNPEVSRNAIGIIAQICRRKKIKTYINPLLDLYRQTNNTLVHLDILENINEILESVGYQSQIEPVYLGALEETNRNYRVAALKGLRLSPDKCFKTSLLKYENDPDLNVRKAAAQLFPPPILEALRSRVADTFLGRLIKAVFLSKKY